MFRFLHGAEDSLGLRGLFQGF